MEISHLWKWSLLQIMQCCQSERKSGAMVFHSFLFILPCWKMRVLFSFYIPFSCGVGTPDTVFWIIYSIGTVLTASRTENAESSFWVWLEHGQSALSPCLRVFLFCRYLWAISAGISTGFRLLCTVFGTVQVQRLFFLRRCYSGVPAVPVFGCLSRDCTSCFSLGGFGFLI